VDYRYGRSPAPTVAEAVASLPDYVVSDAGTDVVNGTYTEDGTNSYGAPRWVHTGGTYFLHSHPDNSHWVISTDGSNAYVGVYYYNDPTPYDQTIPPSSSWVSSAGNDPAPTVAEYVPVLANYIVSGAGWADVNGTYVENGTYNGHPSYFFTGTTYYILFNNGWEGDRWEIVENFEIKEYSTIYFTDATGDTPPSTGWNDNGNPPAPSVAEAVPTLSYSSETFTESINNDGTISNSLVITYTIPGSDYFTGSTGTFSAANYTATNVPAGLTMVITKNSNTELSVSFTGTATNSGSANNISNLEITFNDAAFNAGDASAVTNSTKSDLNVSYYDNVQNCSLSFDGNDDYVSCAASADLPVGNASRTIEAYIKGSSWPTQSNILSWGSSSDNSNRCSIGIYMDHFAFFGGDNILDGSISINDDFWHHVAVVFNGTNMYLYVDGVLDISGAKTLNTSGQDLRIGINASPSDDEYWYGEIDEIRIWNVARSEAEIQANLHNELTGTETGLLAYFKMSNGTGTSLTDNSTSAHTGTISGAVWVNYPHIQPTVTTTAASEITGSTATSGGNLTSTDWTFSCGVCWNTTGTPEISDDHTTDGAGIGSFTSSLTGLHCATTYYVRAYATNNSAKGIVYGNQISFAIDATANGDWQTQQLTLYNTTEAAIMVRSGDIDNLGYGWPVDFDPFSGESTPTHAINFSPEGDDVAGTDQKLKPTSCATVSMPCNNDGYWPTAVYPTAISMSYDLQETTVVAATIQMFVDDFQAETWCATYTASINGVDAPFIANVINSLDQTGPIGKIITLVLPTAHVLLVDAGVI